MLNKILYFFITFLIILNLSLFLTYQSLNSTSFPLSSFFKNLALKLFPSSSSSLSSTVNLSGNQTNPNNDLLRQSSEDNPSSLTSTADSLPEATSSPSPSFITPTPFLVNFYPVQPSIKEKLEKIGIKPLYQLVKDDFKGRSVVYEDNDGNRGFSVISVNPIFQSSDFYIEYIDLNQKNFSNQWARFIINNPNYQKSQIEPLSKETDIQKLLKSGDVIRISFQKKPNSEEYFTEGENIKIIEKLYIQKF